MAKDEKAEAETLARLKKYKETGDTAIRNEIVVEYMYVAEICARQMRGLASGYAQIEDMVNQGIITLMECVEKYDFTRGVAFEKYLFMRIRGCIIDFVRKEDRIPRRVRELSKRIMKAYDEIAGENLSEPTLQQIADRMNISAEQLDKYNAEIAGIATVSFDDLLENVQQLGDVYGSSMYGDLCPEEVYLKGEMRKVLAQAVDELSERERLVISLYYYEDLALNEIAKVMEVSTQRVSQLHTKAVLKLRNRLEAYTKRGE
jgi:RNA polymerase sigma factor for flagellar operon FliA